MSGYPYNPNISERIVDVNSHQIGELVTKVFVVLLGLIVLFLCAYKFFNYCTFRYRSVAVYGVIEDPLQGRDWGGRPYVEYKDLQGKIYGFKTKAKTHWFSAPQKGKKINVFFLKDNPQVAIVDSLFHYVILPLFIGVLGLISVIAGVKNIWQELNHCRN
ncbi:MAG: DUF3592 domain-containing protein [Pseudomonadota bacterium]